MQRAKVQESESEGEKNAETTDIERKCEKNESLKEKVVNEQVTQTMSVNFWVENPPNTIQMWRF